MNPKTNNNTSSKVPTSGIGSIIEKMMGTAKDSRKSFERRWYDNNFFDDGFHYRYISRTTGRMVDLQDKATTFNPMRAIPKASKQIRSIANTLLQPEYVPVVFPDRKLQETIGQQAQQPQPQQQQPGQPPTPPPEDPAKKQAKKVGLWIQQEYKEQAMQQQEALMLINAMKHGISFLKVWPDVEEEKIRTGIRDAFDMFFLGMFHELKDLPYLIEASLTNIAEIKANPNFDEVQLFKINPENKYASSEIKDAYMRSRYGSGTPNDQAATLILKEAFLREYINDDNLLRIRRQKDSEKILAGKNKGDKVYRQVFVAGDIWLRDTYTSLRSYPYEDLRLEPGPLLQTPLIERFIPQNKSYDTIISRIERYANTMASGAWLKRKGENFTPTNTPGGTVYEYEVAPPTQLQMANMPPFMFNFLSVLDQAIAEQGVQLISAKNQKGKVGYQAMEAMKAAEINNLKMASDQLKSFVKRVSLKFLEIADDTMIKPQDITSVNQGQTQEMSVVGHQAYKKMQELDMPTEGLTPLSKEYSVDVQVDSGLGYTPEARKEAGMQLANFLMQMTQAQMLQPQVMQTFLKSLLDSFNYGNTQEFMDQVSQTPMGMAPDQLDQIKLAVAQVFNDIQKAHQQGAQPGAQAPQGQPQPAPQQPAQQQVPQPIGGVAQAR